MLDVACLAVSTPLSLRVGGFEPAAARTLQPLSFVSKPSSFPACVAVPPGLGVSLWANKLQGWVTRSSDMEAYNMAKGSPVLSAAKTTVSSESQRVLTVEEALLPAVCS